MKAAVAYRLGNDREYEPKHKPDWFKEARFNLPVQGGWPSRGEEHSSKNIGAISVVFVKELTPAQKRRLDVLLERGRGARVRGVLEQSFPSLETKEKPNVFISHSHFEKVVTESRFSSFRKWLDDTYHLSFQKECPPFYDCPRFEREHRSTFFHKENEWLNLTPVRTASLLDDAARDMYLAAINKIKQLGKYSEGWDGFDAKAPTAKAVEDAEVFIRKLHHDRLQLPYISLAADGEINFLWNQHSMHLDLGFYGDGKYSYYGRTATGEEYFEDDVHIDSPLPGPILMLLAHT